MEFLSQHGIAFTAKDIRQDPAAIEELIALGSRSTPTTLIDGEMVIGFDRKRLSELLGL
jgi:glutaredoxin